MEEFYAGAKDADYLIYNAAIDDPLDSVSQLLAKSRLFADFKAVKNGNVWCTGKYLYQATDVLGSMLSIFSLSLAWMWLMMICAVKALLTDQSG